MFKKIFSVILAFIISAVTYPLSFMPFKADTDFTVNGGKVYAQSKEGDTVIFNINEETEWFNYYAIKYSSDAYINGEITYGNGFGKEISEEFFLEPAENGVFYSFIDGCLDKVKAKNIISVKIASRQKTDFVFTLDGVSAFNREIPGKEIFISNDEYKIGVDLNWGGALTYMEDLNSGVEAVEKDGLIRVDSNASVRYGKRAVNKHVNLINRHDTGRLVQQSYYGVRNSATYENGSFMDTTWGYNPVQGGNQFNGCSKIVDVRVTDSSIYIKCRPMDWAKNNDSITPSYMEATFKFVENAVHTSCRFVDYSGYEPTRNSQELPAFYCVEPLNRFVCSDESGELTVKPDLPFWGVSDQKRYTSPESWAAFTGEFEDSFGIGLYAPGQKNFIAGVFDRGHTTEKDPSLSNATSYFAVVGIFDFESFKAFEYDYYLTTGDIPEIRANFAKIAN